MVSDVLYRDKKLSREQQAFNGFLCGAWKVQNWFYRPTNEDVARFLRYDDEHDPQFRQTLNWEMPDSRDFFKQCTIPTLILEGKYDKTFSRNRPAEMQVAFPKAQVASLKRPRIILSRMHPNCFILN